MFSRILNITKTCKTCYTSTKIGAQAANPNVVLFKYPELYTKHRTMSTVPDEILNEPARNLDYSQFIEKKKDARSVVIDVREPNEISETGQIPGSILIPLGELQNALGAMPEGEFKQKFNANKPDKNANLIFSCKSGNRSRKALAQAYSLGYANSAHYKGGWLGWVQDSKAN